jgi:predicted metal-dependent HD superfamily phosphohydrolase
MVQPETAFSAGETVLLRELLKRQENFNIDHMFEIMILGQSS